MADDSVFTELFGDNAKGQAPSGPPSPQSDDSFEILRQSEKLPEPHPQKPPSP